MYHTYVTNKNGGRIMKKPVAVILACLTVLALSGIPFTG